MHQLLNAVEISRSRHWISQINGSQSWATTLAVLKAHHSLRRSPQKLVRVSSKNKSKIVDRVCPSDMRWLVKIEDRPTLICICFRIVNIIYICWCVCFFCGVGLCFLSWNHLSQSAHHQFFSQFRFVFWAGVHPKLRWSVLARWFKVDCGLLFCLDSSVRTFSNDFCFCFLIWKNFPCCPISCPFDCFSGHFVPTSSWELPQLLLIFW